ncbi:MAG: MBL fold metallo-hydrolase [Aggregatilineales bacterium]
MLTEITPRCYQTALKGLYSIIVPTPFPVGDVFAYLALGGDASPLTLIDCGVRTDEARIALQAGLAACGVSFRDIERVIITHHHTDHIGFAAEIAAESGAEVWAHRLCTAWLEQPEAARRAFDAYMKPIFSEGGVPEDVIKGIELVSAYLGSFAQPVAVWRTLAEGDQLELLGKVWRVYHTPGHAGDLICLYQPETQVLLSSDHLLRDISSNPLLEPPEAPDEPRPRRLLDYLDSLRRIAQLDIRIAYPGHGAPVTAVAQLVEARFAMHARRAEHLRELCAEQPRSLYALMRAMFPRLRQPETFLALSEVLGHLDLLARDGKVMAEQSDGVAIWRAA